ncbi:pyroglutamyl-peptidase 1 isoform X1 [Alligator sinensis]|uniref:Pyroglutamyl-peptidase 1 isoform X1 n=1 Tax=Alligator sinensis TaxID=38654 RepID=A0A3Q0H1Z9_ALLSI|nr:pyroglutamyl-peptidase 1 isoform X1 [Alligator sinensis]
MGIAGQVWRGGGWQAAAFAGWGPASRTETSRNEVLFCNGSQSYPGVGVGEGHAPRGEEQRPRRPVARAQSGGSARAFRQPRVLEDGTVSTCYSDGLVRLESTRLMPAGLQFRYLCDFTYYTSLYQSRGRSAFVHVPPLGKPYTAEQLGRALQAIVEEMLDVLEQSEGKINCQHEH